MKFRERKISFARLVIRVFIINIERMVHTNLKISQMTKSLERKTRGETAQTLEHQKH